MKGNAAMTRKKTSVQLDREIAAALARPRASRHHATKAESPEDAWLVVMDALLSGDAALAAQVWNRLYYEHEMAMPPPPERFTKALKSKGRNKIDKGVLARFKQLAPKYETSTKRNARIVRGRGMGGYMDPPGYPTHTFHVETDLGRRPHNRGSVSLEAAQRDRSIDATTRKEASDLLDDWDRDRPPLDSPKVRAWIAEVLRHFGKDRGVERIQKFYPEYEAV
jgi:hypothetical protein